MFMIKMYVILFVFYPPTVTNPCYLFIFFSHFMKKFARRVKKNYTDITYNNFPLTNGKSLMVLRFRVVFPCYGSGIANISIN